MNYRNFTFDEFMNVLDGVVLHEQGATVGLVGECYLRLMEMEADFLRIKEIVEVYENE